jgi:multimeric flavodoxin WrbA
MGNNIVLLSGSPRKGANTDKLAAAFKSGAESAGKNISLFRAADMKIGGCMGCNHCIDKNGVCVQKDDMPAILDALRKADVLVLASPIYFFSITAQLKLVIDRAYALDSNLLPIKKAALLVTCGDESKKAADGAVVTYKSILAYYDWKDFGTIIVPGLENPEDIDGREELEQARKLGLAI